MSLNQIAYNGAKSLTQVARSPLSGISVCVVGAGPAGVYTALQCWRKGHNVRILERNPVARTQGRADHPSLSISGMEVSS